MRLKVKDDVDLEDLRKYGFKPGKEWAKAGERCMGYGYEYQHEEYHKFLLEDNGKVRYANEEYDQPTIQISVHTESRTIDVDCVSEYSYRIGTPEMDIVLETIFRLAQDGLLEMEE